jgi:hypothetical protein
MIVARDCEFTTNLVVTSETEHAAAPENVTGAWASPLWNHEFTTDLAVISETENGAAPENVTGTWASPLSWNREFTTDLAVTSVAELQPAPQSKTAGWASMLSWNVTTLTFLLILSITLNVYLIAVNDEVKRCKDHRNQHDIQENNNHFTVSSSAVPLLKLS